MVLIPRNFLQLKHQRGELELTGEDNSKEKEPQQRQREKGKSLRKKGNEPTVWLRAAVLPRRKVYLSRGGFRRTRFPVLLHNLQKELSLNPRGALSVFRLRAF